MIAIPAVRIEPSAIDRLLKPVHRWIWLDAHRRARKLLRFAETEADGGRDLSRAAELTGDPLLRRLFLRHAQDESRHADLFRARGRALLSGMPRRAAGLDANWIAPGERGLDDLDISVQREGTLLAFLHLSEKAAAGRFTLYGDVLDGDPATRAVFERVLEDEAFHMTYTRKQLARLSPRKQGLELWKARAARVWKAYLRLAMALASAIGFLVLTLQY
ncbi:MAG: ferritin-like domain-containing protein, partial [Myxococcales bacterium]